MVLPISYCTVLHTGNVFWPIFLGPIQFCSHNVHVFVCLKTETWHLTSSHDLFIIKICFVIGANIFTHRKIQCLPFTGFCLCSTVLLYKKTASNFVILWWICFPPPSLITLFPSVWSGTGMTKSSSGTFPEVMQNCHITLLSTIVYLYYCLTIILSDCVAFMACNMLLHKFCISTIIQESAWISIEASEQILSPLSKTSSETG